MIEASSEIVIEEEQNPAAVRAAQAHASALSGTGPGWRPMPRRSIATATK